MKNKHKFTYSKNYAHNNPKIAPKKRFIDKVKENLNKILFWVIITAFCLFTVGSTLGTVAFFKTAKADSVEETAIYQGNSLIVPTQAYSGTSPAYGTSTGRCFLLSFDYIISVTPYVNPYGIVQNDILFQLKAYTNTAYSSLDGYVDRNDDLSPIYLVKNNDFIQYNFRYGIGETYQYLYLRYKDIAGYTNNYAFFTLYQVGNFNGNVTSIKFNSYDSTNIIEKTGYYYVTNTIELIDNNNNKFIIEIPCCTQDIYTPKNALMLENRTYFNSNNFGEDINFSNGYRDGYDKGMIKGEQVGYNKGKAEGIEEGFADGKAYGIAHSNDYTLYALISSIFNVPITSFVHLINFEFFGVNLANFFTGILTMAVILFVVSKLFGK